MCRRARSATPPHSGCLPPRDSLWYRRRGLRGISRLWQRPQRCRPRRDLAGWIALLPDVTALPHTSGAPGESRRVSAFLATSSDALVLLCPWQPRTLFALSALADVIEDKSCALMSRGISILPAYATYLSASTQNTCTQQLPTVSAVAHP